MEEVLLVIHLIVTLGLIGLVLLQKSEGGGLGIGGGGMGALAGFHQTANVLTRTTAVFAVLFFLTNLSLAYLAKQHSQPSAVIEQAVEGESAPVEIEEVVPPAAPLAE